MPHSSCIRFIYQSNTDDADNHILLLVTPTVFFILFSFSTLENYGGIELTSATEQLLDHAYSTPSSIWTLAQGIFLFRWQNDQTELKHRMTDAAFLFGRPTRRSCSRIRSTSSYHGNQCRSQPKEGKRRQHQLDREVTRTNRRRANGNVLMIDWSLRSSLINSLILRQPLVIPSRKFIKQGEGIVFSASKFLKDNDKKTLFMFNDLLVWTEIEDGVIGTLHHLIQTIKITTS